ncbi:undecaprenyl-diphosphate phosphatase [Temperatibacter marinus]|uniref:Undecaprenyl-diphosphatase n=1 Tax=Temperatibacter marinus TaxID=1456591 RepID=A0AA52EES5_9PROT|nr:undecaprenyl-diphosphate phosphatase [Temperatibacter marinus]WND03466.1 undecaprenyl-diphosphate phosphatase [Temperatibacter marinus]
MTLLHILILALVQGITEFLPISSSGHLVLVPFFSTLPDQGHLMDVAVHVGTLFAVLLYFWRDTRGLALAGFSVIGITSTRKAIEGTSYAKMFWALIIGTLPIVIIGGMIAQSNLIDTIRTAEVIAITSIFFGILLWFADRKDVKKAGDSLGIKAALYIGLAQVLAIIPGTSRSGITMTAARFMGFNREIAARFSMLLSIPTIIAAGTLGALEIASSEELIIWQDALLAAGLSFVFAMGAIHFLMRWVQTRSMTLFVVYRILLGIIILSLL